MEGRAWQPLRYWYGREGAREGRCEVSWMTVDMLCYVCMYGWYEGLIVLF